MKVSVRYLFKALFSLLTTFIAMTGSAQDSTWKKASLTPNVAVDMPGPTWLQDTTQIIAINSRLDEYYFQLKYIKQKFEVKNGDELIQAYDGFLSGYFKSSALQNLTNTFTDTSFSGTRGEWVRSIYTNGAEMYTYVVLVNSYFYMVTIASGKRIDLNDPAVHRYFGSLRFPVQPIKEYSGDFPLQSKSYRNGQHIGRFVMTYLPPALIVGLIVLVVFLVYRWIRRRKNNATRI